MKRITLLLTPCILFSIFSNAQVGINTTNPQGVFNIDAAKDNPTSGTPTSIQALNDITVNTAGNFGIGTNSPQRKLHVNASSSSVRFENLATLPSNVESAGLVMDSNGDIYKNNTVSVEGQIIRIGLNGATYGTTSESALRFSANDTAAEMGNAPNNASNFINTIVGSNITDGVNTSAGQGSPARTTDQITLQPGVYKIQVRLVGSFGGTSNNNNIFLKSIVNNNEYSLVNLTNPTTQTQTYYFDDYVNITGGAQTVDFSILPTTNSFTISSNLSPGTGNSYRSLFLIQRLR